MRDLFPYLPLLFVAFGAVIILKSIKGIIDGKQFVRQAQRVPGVVSDVRTTFVGQGENLRATQWPVLTFTTVEGQEITTEAATPSGLGIGNETEVLYDPQDPTSAMPAGNADVGYSGIVIGLFFFSAFSRIPGSSSFSGF
ncbi:DUF3592 domain-containing protein [Nonomuraea aurantiaca]|uniref:DUF3592 domain-containing protein n=1 Tax=Nonomuraea aurantiaca TaxID=2878562 RepID=UPI001CD9C31E|nr:DUF3592 domain-containing protein [Nonomuraea aurantiaca]MCA2227746.1 DUF3592 domain-containing protein [Nonomuraea aurantiaca]